MDILTEKEEKLKKKVTKELSVVINANSLDTETDTPDYVLASYLWECIKSYNKASIYRKQTLS